MNITELARKLKVSTKELKILLPELGFDIGRKAIKVDDKVANQIIKDWGRLLAEFHQKLSLSQTVTKKTDATTTNEQDLKPIPLPQKIAVRELAGKLNLPLSIIMKELMKNGILVSLNEPIDFDTAAIIAEDLGKKVTKTETAEEGGDTADDKHSKLKKIIQKETGKNLKKRPPVIVVMGHVDHGKTKLLDAIRKTDIVAQESGGITQHIGAYQIEKSDALLTFIDTPGHEAFTTMRTRGSRVADLAILIVAADDGVQPQTVEALRIIKNEQLPMVVAINKIDKPEANIEKVKKELANQNIIPEEWGGKTIFLPISAKSGEGIDKLIDILLLLAETEEEKLLTDWERLPAGTVIESHMDKSEGIVATILIQAGVLGIGNIVSIDNAYYGKIRVMKNHLNKNIDKAQPGTPVKVVGLKAMPSVGDIIEIKEKMLGLERKIKTVSREQIATPTIASQDDNEEEDSETPGLKLILKTDTLGSAEAILETLAKLNLPTKFKIDIIHKGLGNINEDDLNRAKAAQAVIIGFHVQLPTALTEHVKIDDIEVKIFKIIYELIDFLKEKITTLAEPTYKRKELGAIKILKIFKQTKAGQIIGGLITKGEINPNFDFDIVRQEKTIGEGRILEIQSGKETITSASSGQECGLEIKSLITIEPKDILQVWQKVQEDIKL